MPRVKRGIIKHKKRERTLKETKGFRWGRKNLRVRAKESLLHARRHAFVGRKQKKRTSRQLWNVKINAGVRQYGLSYSAFMHLLEEHGIKLNRKMLAYLAEHEPQEFQKLVDQVKE